jgi:hypothetical protein
MTTPAELYINGIKKKLRNYYAAWLPSEKLQLGDVGVLNGNVFSRTSTLASLGISFVTRPDPNSTPLDYVSESGVSIFLKGAGEVSTQLPNIPEAKAGIGVEFSKQGAFVFKAPDSHQPVIEDIRKLEQDVVRAYQSGNWRTNWAIVVRLVETPTATIMVSNSSQSKVEFAVEGAATAGPIDFGNVSLDFGLRVEKGDVFKVVGGQNLTPIFQLAQLKTRWFKDPTFSIRAFHAGSAMDEITPALTQRDQSVADALYLDLIRDDVK